MAREDSDTTVRRKAVYAISSCVRNYQPALDQLREHLPAEIVGADEKIDAGDMDKIDAIIAHLKQAWTTLDVKNNIFFKQSRELYRHKIPDWGKYFPFLMRPVSQGLPG